MKKTPLVSVEDVRVAYRHGDSWMRALHGVSFTITAGETFGLAGESGCGKSTIAYHLLGYRHPDSRLEGGRLLFRGEDVLTMDHSKLACLRGDRIALVPQNPTTSLNPGMRVGSQLIEVLHEHMPNPERTLTAHRMIELFGLVGLPDPGGIGHCYPHQLSGGQQQRVMIAMALACRPDLLVLDEPTTGLDVTTQKQILDLLRDLRGQFHMAMLYVTHDLGVLNEIAERVGVMYAGHMVEIAPTEELFRAPRHPYTRGLIASRLQLDTTVGAPARMLHGLLRRQELPAGCPFAPRCDYAEPSCALTTQYLEPVAFNHSVACQRWRAIEVPSTLSGPPPAKRPTPQDDVPPVLRIEGVSLAYGMIAGWSQLLQFRPREIVSDLTLRIDGGETLALVGESGSGKSTIARAISGLLTPLAGRMQFLNEPLLPSIRSRPTEIRRQIQYIFQNPDASLNPRMKIGDILAQPLLVFYRFDEAKVRQRVARALDDVRLESAYVARYPDQLSGGERQRVAIARALIAEPVLLLCDEVLSALDVSVQASIIELFRRLRREHHLAMLFISHDLAVVRTLADKVSVLFRGQLVETGSVADIFAPPFHPYTHSLLLAVPGVQTTVPAPPVARRQASAIVSPQRGCVFAGVCPWQLGSVCESTPPPWQHVGGGHNIRCHIPHAELKVKAIWRGPKPIVSDRQLESPTAS
jgi:peptide/nickel transport system ATP-binding protein